MPAQAARKPAARTAKLASAPKIETEPSRQAQAASTPKISVEGVPVVYFRPSVTFPDGRTVVCEHRYLHEHEKAAAACGRKIAALGAFVK